jgi:hypothetical protein
MELLADDLFHQHAVVLQAVEVLQLLAQPRLVGGEPPLLRRQVGLLCLEGPVHVDEIDRGHQR